ncbi:hypothetical protein BDV93DRAFT_562284 [Ceratobasidium sp. AG-I]|nr:hypothetical protein BDV93DRAFT_562284 [Ceratobasidium sp. AG-I]
MTLTTISAKSPLRKGALWSAPEKCDAPDRVGAQGARDMVLRGAPECSRVLVWVQSQAHERSGALQIHWSGWSHPPRSGAKPDFAEMQHCLQEWGTGRFGSLDLNASRQLKMYESHLNGLLADYAGALLEEDELYQATTQANQIRPDTPDS